MPLCLHSRPLGDRAGGCTTPASQRDWRGDSSSLLPRVCVCGVDVNPGQATHQPWGERRWLWVGHHVTLSHALPLRPVPALCMAGGGRRGIAGILTPWRGSMGWKRLLLSAKGSALPALIGLEDCELILNGDKIWGQHFGVRPCPLIKCDNAGCVPVLSGRDPELCAGPVIEILKSRGGPAVLGHWPPGLHPEPSCDWSLRLCVLQGRPGWTGH